MTSNSRRANSGALIVKFGAIGDVIMAIPAAYALHQHGMQIDWVCGQAVAPLLACYPWIQTIVADDRALLTGSKPAQLKVIRSLWKALAGRQYKLCATLYCDNRYRSITFPIRAERKVMLSLTNRDTKLLPGRHHTDEYARILLGTTDTVRPAQLAPIRPEGLPPSPLPRIVNKPRVVLAPAGARNMLRDDALRRWPAESYAQLTRELLALGLDVVLTGGPDDQWVLPTFADIPATNLIGKLTLLELLALLDDSEVMVTHDTGPLHLAGITRIGIVSIFGPTDPRGRLPQRLDTVAIWGGEGFACRPCYDGQNFAPCPDNACMKQVTVPIVLDQVNTVLEQRRSGSKPPRIVAPASTVVTHL